ncbi:MAG: hypothetical protein ACRCXZ_03560 [Patescibacteria group bacterium]
MKNPRTTTALILKSSKATPNKLCLNCFAIYSSSRCTCSSDDFVYITAKDRIELSSHKGKNYEKKRKKAIKRFFETRRLKSERNYFFRVRFEIQKSLR